MNNIKMKIKQHWCALVEESFWFITIDWDKAELWYKEMMRRFNLLSDDKTEDEKQLILKNFPCFDIDESYECWEIGIPHLISMLTFLRNNND